MKSLLLALLLSANIANALSLKCDILGEPVKGQERRPTVAEETIKIDANGGWQGMNLKSADGSIKASINLFYNLGDEVMRKISGATDMKFTFEGNEYLARKNLTADLGSDLLEIRREGGYDRFLLRCILMDRFENLQ
jgi:hypothetical protein